MKENTASLKLREASSAVMFKVTKEKHMVLRPEIDILQQMCGPLLLFLTADVLLSPPLPHFYQKSCGLYAGLFVIVL